MVRVLVCGDRHWKDEDAIRRVLKSIPNLEVVIEGEADGADKLSRKVAEEMGVLVLPFTAKWHKYGLAAGPIRNRVMLDDGKPDWVVAFHDNLRKSKGTSDMIAQAQAFGIPVKIVGTLGGG